MAKRGRRQSVAGRRRSSETPLISLRPLEVLKTIVERPHRLGELVGILGERDWKLRGRAAVTIARLSESHPGCLLTHLRSLTDAANDESAHVRWNLTFALGKICCSFPDQSESAIASLIMHLRDTDVIVRAISGYALAEVARTRPDSVMRSISGSEQALPDWLGGILKRNGCRAAQRENK